MSEYSVTPIIWQTEDEQVLRLYKDVERRLRFRQFQVETGLDYNVYGNSFTSVLFGLEKYLGCRKCDMQFRARTNRSLYKWRSGRFHLRCTSCRYVGPAKQHDYYPRSVRRIRIVRWNPENIDIKHNDVTGANRYYYRLPRRIRNDIKLGDRETIETLPAPFLEAARRGKALLFKDGSIFHLKRPTVATKDMGWGSPLIYPLLKDAFYLQVLKKAQEALMMEHTVPLRMIFPGPSTGGNDKPYSAYNLGAWKSKIDAEINVWRRDPNYIPILPVNMGYQQLGGTAKALILHHEFRLFAEQMLSGMGIPPEFVMGGLQWSASNTALRGLENTFLGYNEDRYGLMDWVVEKLSSHMQWPKVPFAFGKFKMADDLQRSMFLFQLNQAQKISDRRLLEDIGEDFDLENKRMGEELNKQIDTQRKMQLAAADVQGAAQLRTGRYQAKVQELQMAAQMRAQMEAQMAQQQGAGGAPGQEQQPQQGQEAQPQQGQEQGQEQPAGASEGSVNAENAQAPNESAVPTAMAGMESPINAGQQGGFDLTYVAQRAASYLRQVKEEGGEQAMYQEMQRMQMENPNLYRLVVQLMNDQGANTDPMNAIQMPQPSQRAQRRDPARQT